MASSGAGLGPPGAVSDPLGPPEALQAEIAFSSITKGFSLFSGLAIHRPLPPSQGPAGALWGPPRPSVALRGPLGSTGALWGQLGPSGGRLERPGAVWARLGRSGPVWGHLGPSEGRPGPTGAAWGRPGGNCIFLDRNIRSPSCSDSQKDRDPQGGASGGLGLSGAVGGRLGPPGALKDPQGKIFFLISSCLGPSGAVWGPLGPPGAGPRKRKNAFFDPIKNAGL